MPASARSLVAPRRSSPGPVSAVLPPAWERAVEDWQHDQQAEGTAASTISWRSKHLRRFALTSGKPDPFTVSKDDLTAWVLIASADAKTQTGYRRSFRVFYAWAVATGRMASDPSPRRQVTGGKPRSVAGVWGDAIQAWQDDLRYDHPDAIAITRGAQHLRRFATTCHHADPFTVTTQQLASWARAQSWQVATATAHRSSLRNFYAWAAATGRTSDNPALYLSAVNAGHTSDVARQLGASGPLPEPVPPAWEAALRLFTREERASGRSERTIRLHVEHLSRLARDLHPLEPFAVTFYDLVEWMAAHTWAIETRRSHRSTLRNFYAWAVEAELIATNPAAKLPKTGVGLPNPHPASETAVHFAILTAPPRERTMVRLGAELGLRRIEVSRVHSRDIVDDEGGWSLLVHGKGARDRLLPLPNELASELRNLPPGWAFPSERGGHLTEAWVGKLVSRQLPEGVTMHALRHRFATRAHGLEHDVFAVQQLLGHASPETTRRYVAISNETLRRTVQTLAATTTRLPQQVSR